MLDGDEITLNVGAAQALNSALLQEPGTDDLGGEADIDFGDLEVRIGSRPVVTDLGSLYTESKKELPPEFRATFDGFRLWLVTFRVSSLRVRGMKRLESISIEIRYEEKPRVTITDLFPRPQFVKRFATDASANLRATANIDLAGRFQLPEELMLSAGDVIGAPVTAGAKGELTLGGKVGIVGQLSCQLATPTIEAVGRGDYWCKWILFRASQQILLNDIELSHVIAVPRVVKKLKPAVRVEATASTFGFLPVTIRSGEVPLDAALR